MDILAHGLWAGAAAKIVNKKSHLKLNAWWAVFWGVFPDLFAFTIPFAWLFWNSIFGNLPSMDFSAHEADEPPSGPSRFPIFQIASTLYNYSHSVIVFVVVFGIVFLIFRRPIWVLGAWLLHILIDIPTHSYQFYPTPFLWPLLGWKFNGFSWATPWFLILNYLSLFVVFLWFLNRDRKQKSVE